MLRRQSERHRAGQAGWLRAAVLGANDGILSIARLVLGVAAASGSRSSVLIAGLAGLVAGAMSMAAGEDVSVPAQSRYPWDYYKTMRSIEAAHAFRPLAEGGCTLGHT